MKIPWHTEHAYSVRETGSFGGGDHIVIEKPLHLGRLKRKARDPLCKPRDKFKFLDIPDDEETRPNCKKCIEIAKRLDPSFYPPAQKKK